MDLNTQEIGLKIE
jgi:hypothetical protein